MLRISNQNLQKAIEKLLAEGHTSLQQVASKLGVSSRTLQRELAKNKYSYSKMVDEIRYTKALKMLKQDKFKAKEIAVLLGYSDAGSFSRAFIRWSGFSPIAYRNRIR